MDLQLHNKTALVTGSTQGIGYATAYTLLREGAEVYVNGRSQKGTDEAVAKLAAEVPGAKVHAVGDCTGSGLIRKATDDGARAACSI